MTESEQGSSSLSSSIASDEKVARPLIVGAYTFPHGDATSNRLLQLARSAAPDNARTLIVNDVMGSGSDVPGEDEIAGIQLISLRIRGSNRLTRMAARLARPVRVSLALRRRGIRAGDVSVVLLPMAMMTLLTWSILRFSLRCPVVVDATERHDHHQFKRGRLEPYFVRHRWSMFLATRLIHRATAVSTNLARHLAQHGMDVLVVPPQVDCEEYAPSRPPSITGGLRLLYAGTPGRKDMLNTILCGISTLAPCQQKRVHLVIAGIARHEASTASDLDVGVLDHISAEVEFLGRVSRDTVLRLLSQSHFSMLVRPTEGYAMYGFPSKIPESLAAGCPVMLNHTSDLSTYIRDHAEGFVLAGTEADDIRAVIERALLLKDEDWATMSKLARLRALRSFDHRVWRDSVGSKLRF